ncbi:hypothetical protein [Schlesneria paludicola]|uniref:hypothetical protein n=1 Tax=Schlesneria paludicola TaxID=360056 RepID=UPI00029B3CA1|nr:hypothetical protein [Schlesneria paludicola]
MRASAVLLLPFVVACQVATGIAADPIAWLPGDINAVARINVADIYKSQLAIKEGWLKKSTEAFIQQEAFVPPGTSLILTGADLEISNGVTATRTFSVLVPDKQMTLETLSTWVPGRLEQFLGKPLGNFGSNGYVADTGDGYWLTNGSSNRQMITRWLKTGVTPGAPQLSDYLKSALNSKDSTAQLLMAIDLQDNFSGQAITEELKATDWFKTDFDAETIAKVLERVQGITIAITVSDTALGQATVDFGIDTTPLKPVMDQLVAAVLEHAGISDKEVENWKWITKGKQVIGNGPVAPGAGRRLVSILEPPSITMSIAAKPADAGNAATPDADLVQKVSLKYSKSIQVLLEDLRKELSATNRINTNIVLRYARKIDNVPTLNVDGALLDFAAKVSNSLRYQSQSIRMNNLGAITQKANSFGTTYYGANNNGYVGSYTAGPGVGMSIDASNRQASRAVVYSEWKQIEDGLVALRRAMTEKYKVQF